MIKHVGCARSEEEIEALKIKALELLAKEDRDESQLELFSKEDKKETTVKIKNWYINGYHKVFGKIYDEIGFPGTGLLRDLVVARIAFPRSKIATIRYLKSYLGIEISKDKLYRFLDTLDKKEITQISYDFVKQKHSQGISICFYDVTTLYFESSQEDELRQKGYSKDHRSDMPQILIGLFVDDEGYPFDFDYFDGKTFEGHTFEQSVEMICKRYDFKQLTVIADAGMLSQENLNYLKRENIFYIVGARLKNISDSSAQEFLAHSFERKPTYETTLEDKRLIVDYSESRRKQDLKNRERILLRLRKKLEGKKTLVKKTKFLKFEGKQKILGIDDTQIEKDSLFDGLKGYYTNLSMQTGSEKIIEQYHQLWKVERAFRMSKHDLQQRPIYHFKPNRIKAHLLLCFASLLVMKETESRLKKIKCSLDQAIELLGKVVQGKVQVGNVTLMAESEINPLTQKILNLFAGH